MSLRFENEFPVDSAGTTANNPWNTSHHIAFGELRPTASPTLQAGKILYTTTIEITFYQIVNFINYFCSNNLNRTYKKFNITFAYIMTQKINSETSYKPFQSYEQNTIMFIMVFVSLLRRSAVVTLRDATNWK